MKSLQLKGCGTALVTPFRGDAVDLDAFRRMVSLQVEAGVDFLVPLGSTGETPCLDDDEKVAVASACREMCPLPMMVGVGTNSLRATLRNIDLLAPCRPDALLVVVPYYNKPTQEGMYRYFKAVSEYTDIPLVLYNVPGRTGSNMTAETTLRLAELPGIVAIKEASSNFAQISDIAANAPEGFSVLSGNDDETLSLIRAGARGVVSVASNIAPALVSRLARLALSGRIDEASELHERLSPLFRSCFVESNPIPVKAALSLMGLMEPGLRLPLTEAVPSTVETMRETLSALGVALK